MTIFAWLLKTLQPLKPCSLHHIARRPQHWTAEYLLKVTFNTEPPLVMFATHSVVKGLSDHSYTTGCAVRR